MNSSEPMFNIPGPVLGLLAIMAGLHVLRFLMPPEAADWLLLSLAFIPGRVTFGVEDLPGGEVARYASFLTHAFVHGHWLHLGFNAIWLTIFGSVLARRLGWLRFLAFFGFAAIMGAVAFLVINPELFAPVVGASGAVSGFMAATLRLLTAAIDIGGVGWLREAPDRVPLPPLRAAMADKRILLATAVVIAINLLTVLGLGDDGGSGGIAWEAHAGGFLAGLLAFGLFDVHVRKETDVNRVEN